MFVGPGWLNRRGRWEAPYELLAKSYDDTDLANGIIWCLENNKDKTLSKNARQKVLDNYTIDIVAKQYKDLYESLV